MSEKKTPVFDDPDRDHDIDEDGDVDVDHYPIPAELLKAAGIETDEDWDAL